MLSLQSTNPRGFRCEGYSLETIYRRILRAGCKPQGLATVGEFDCPSTQALRIKAASNVNSPSSIRRATSSGCMSLNCATSPSWLIGTTPSGNHAAIPVQVFHDIARAAFIAGPARQHAAADIAAARSVKDAGRPLPRFRAPAPAPSNPTPGSSRPPACPIALGRSAWSASAAAPSAGHRVETPVRCTAKVVMPRGRTTARSTVPSMRPSGSVTASCSSRQVCATPASRMARAT